MINMKFNKILKIAGFFFVAILIGCWTIVVAEEGVINEGLGKPRALDIYIGDFPYSSSIGGNISSGKEEVPNDFKVIKDDKNFDEPEWFYPTETPIVPTPTATAVIPVDLGGVGASVCVMDNTTDVIVDFAYSSAGYKNEFRLSKPRTETLGWSEGEMPNDRKGTSFGTTWNLGKFPAGTELIFSDTANGKTYYTGPSSRNPDKLAHAAITFKNSGTHHRYLVSFEDFWNGGDKDYNDLEFYLSGELSTGCAADDDTGSGVIIPIYVNGTVCKCKSPKYNDPMWNSKGKVTCVAQFTYESSSDGLEIPIHVSSLPWNEFTGSGMVKQYRCQPKKFYIDVRNAPFWTNRFSNNIMWKLGHDQSILVKCEKNTPWCDDISPGLSDTICNYCSDGYHY